jgi:hypothetical protein
MSAPMGGNGGILKKQLQGTQNKFRVGEIGPPGFFAIWLPGYS